MNANALYYLVACLALAFLVPPRASEGRLLQLPCRDVAALRLPDVHVTEAVAVGADEAEGVSVAHCKVAGVIGKEIRFELLLPDAWNGRLFMGGGGGFVGEIANSARASVNRGYATVGTDTGHQGNGLQAGWALNNLERQLNFGHVAVHRTAEVAKAILYAYYGADAEFSYFLGCSRGGGQALMEAQRYPDDFDGIVAGAPALDWPGLAAEFVQNVQLNFPDPGALTSPVVTPQNVKLLATKVLEACDALDGVEDGVMEDPRACPFDVASLPACPEDRPGADCVTQAQRAAIARIYAPATSGPDTIYPGQPFGGEADPWGWQNWITGVNEHVPAALRGNMPSLQFGFGTEFFKYFVFGDAHWNYARYDFATWAEDTKAVATFMNATNPDLSAFAARGGKLVLWHGWSDAALTALASIDYYEAARSLDPDLPSYFRMFLMPGVLHCGGGPGPDAVDWFGVIAAWVERGEAPQRLVAAKHDTLGQVVRTRPLCPYPQRAVYTGSGSTDDAANFACRAP